MGRSAPGKAATRWSTSPTLRSLREGLGDVGDELLGEGFHIGGAALVVLVVAEGGLGVGQSPVQEVSLSGGGDSCSAASRYMMAMLPRVWPAP